jgi:hypothetical protein
VDWVANADGGGARQLTGAVVLDAHTIDWHPDGRSLLVSTHSSSAGVFLVDAVTGHIV